MAQEIPFAIQYCGVVSRSSGGGASAANRDSWRAAGRFAMGSYRELANRVGNALLAGGCACGDRVLIVLRDSAEFMAAFFGAAKIGAIPVPVNSFARTGDYSFYVSDSGASIAIVDEGALGEFAPAARASNVPIVVVGGDNSGFGYCG